MKRLCSEPECHKSVAKYSMHSTCFECTALLRGGVACEPPDNVCDICIDEYKSDETFRKAMQKGQRDRENAQKKAKKRRLIFVEDDTGSSSDLGPSPKKSTYLL